MAYYTRAEKQIGNFIEEDFGNNFEYSLNETGMFPEYPHIVWVGSIGDQGFRFAKVKKTVAYILTDEDMVERWYLKKNDSYTLAA
jgi:hypothetical protein|tara:strand:- start:3811 stop:4065 length:255 start_codon:yes stop_codon:yes gene_type:complete